MKRDVILLVIILLIVLGWCISFLFVIGSLTLSLPLWAMLLLGASALCQSLPTKCKPWLTTVLLVLALFALLGFSYSMLFVPLAHPLIVV